MMLIPLFIFFYIQFFSWTEERSECGLRNYKPRALINTTIFQKDGPNLYEVAFKFSIIFCLDSVKSSWFLFGKEELLIRGKILADRVGLVPVDQKYRDSPVSAVSINAVPGIVQFLRKMLNFKKIIYFFSIFFKNSHLFNLHPEKRSEGYPVHC